MRDVSGQWLIRQGNGFIVTVKVIQDERQQLTGSAAFFAGSGNDRHEVQSSEIDGSVSDTDFVMNISWNDGTRGRYVARFEPDGILTGETFDQMHPTSQATWESDRTFPQF